MKNENNELLTFATFTTTRPALFEGAELSPIQQEANKLDSLAWDAIRGIETSKLMLAVALGRLEKMLIDKDKAQVFEALGVTSINKLCEVRFKFAKASASEYIGIGGWLVAEFNGKAILDADGVPFSYSAHKAMYYSKLSKARLAKMITTRKILATETIATLKETLNTESSVIGEGTPKKRKNEPSKNEPSKNEPSKPIIWVVVKYGNTEYHIPETVAKDFTEYEKRYTEEHAKMTKI